MDIAKLPETLTRPQVEALRNAFGYFYDQGNTSNFKDKISGLHFKDPAEFIDEIWTLGIPKDTSIKSIGITLENWYETVTQAPEFKGAGESSVSANKPSNEQLEQFEKEAEVSKSAHEETVYNAKTSVEAAIRRRQEIYESLKNKKVVVTPTEELPKVNLTADEKEKIWNLAQTIKSDEVATQKIIEQKIKESVNKSSPEIRTNITEPVITRTAQDLIEKVKPLAVYSSPDKIPNTISVLNPISPFISISDPNNPKLKELVSNETVRNELSKSAQTLSASLEAKNNIDCSLTKPLFENSENISSLFYPQTYTNFQIAENQESQQEKDNGAEIDLQGTYKQGRQVWDFWQKIKSGSATVDEVITSTGIVPYSTAAVSEASSIVIAGLPTTMGAIVGISTTMLPSYYISFSTPLLTAPAITQTLAPVFSLPATIATSAPSILTYTRFIDGVETQIFSSLPSNMTVFTAEEVATGLSGTLGTEAISQIGGTAVKQSLNITIGNAFVNTASQIALKLGFTEASAQIGAAIGTGIIPVIGTIVGVVVGAIVGKIAEHINWKKVKEWGGAIIGGTVALISAPFVGIGAALGIGAAATVGSVALGAGLGGVTIGGIGAGITGFFGAIGGAFVISIATPVIVTLLVFPVVVALILFIINSGAYIVPPSGNTTYNPENPYINVEKTASPKGPFENSALPITVEYTIKIAAKISPLSNVRLDYKCEILKKGAKPNCPDIGDAIPKTDTIGTISPSNSYSFKYTMTYSGNSFTDSFISDTITVTADTPDKSNVTTSGSASIIIGKPDIGCYKVLTGGQYAVPSQYMKMYNDSIFKIIQDWPAYVAKTCPTNGGQVNIGYGGPNAYWGWHLHQADVDFILYQQPVSTTLVRTEFTMIHELGHHIENVNPQYYIQYIDYPGIVIPICSYSATWSGGDDAKAESFSETVGLYGSGRSMGDSLSCAGETATFKEKYPINWKFADTIIFH